MKNKYLCSEMDWQRWECPQHMCRSDPWHNPSAAVPLLYSDGKGIGTMNHMEEKRILGKCIKYLYRFSEGR